MASCGNFQTQITAIIDIITESAISEIIKFLEDSSFALCVNISRNLHGNEALKNKLHALQNGLGTARGHKAAGMRERSVNTRSVGVQGFVQQQHRERVSGPKCCFNSGRNGEPAGAGDVDAPLQTGIFQTQSANKGNARTEPLFIKQERLEEDLYYSDPQPSSPGGQVIVPISIADGKKPGTESTLFGDPEELREMQSCGHSDEELSGLEFVVKVEQEGEHVAQGLNLTGCGRSVGRLSNLGSEYVLYKRDDKLWTSVTQENSDIESDDPVCCSATEQCLQSLSILSPIHQTPATMEDSGSALSFVGASCVEEFDKMGEKPSVCSEELRSVAIHTQQGQHRERLAHTVEGENQTLLSQQQQQHGPSVKHRRGSESPAQPHSGSHYETGCTLSTGADYTGKRDRKGKQAVFGKKQFICSHCGKSFTFCSHLIAHQRIHTGEKPYSCRQCGRSFSRKNNLVQHEWVHSNNKPFGCTQCGKRFTRGTSLRAHQRIHTGERPYHCIQCGKSFSHHRPFAAHQRNHTGVRAHSCK